MNAWFFAVVVTVSVALAGCSSEGGEGSGSEPLTSVSQTEADPSTDQPAESDSESEPAPESQVEPEADPEPVRAPVASEGLVAVAQTQVTASGNRFLAGEGSVLDQPELVQLPAPPLWVLRWPDAQDPGWLVTLTDGSSVIVSDAGGAVAAGPSLPADVAAGAAPEVVDPDDGSDLGLLVRSAVDSQDRFDDPLPDARVVSDGALTAALVGPTDRYPHAVLGDGLEGAAVELIDEASGVRTRVDVDDPAVIEGISPLLADVDQDGSTDVLVTISDADSGAALAAFRQDGSLLAASDPIGLGRRWRNQMAVGPVGPNGEVEVVDVRTPHIGGTVEFFRHEDGRLVLAAASEDRFTSHVIGSRNLDLAVMADGNGDGRPDVIVPTQSLGALAVLTRTTDGVEVAEVGFDGSIATNLAADSADGQLSFAVGINTGGNGGSLAIWPG